MTNKFYKLGFELALKTAGLGSIALHGGVGAGLGALGGGLVEYGLNPKDPKIGRGAAIGGLAGLGIGSGIGAIGAARNFAEDAVRGSARTSIEESGKAMLKNQSESLARQGVAAEQFQKEMAKSKALREGWARIDQDTLAAKERLAASKQRISDIDQKYWSHSTPDRLNILKEEMHPPKPKPSNGIGEALFDTSETYRI